jgi:hypothetical protein
MKEAIKIASEIFFGPVWGVILGYLLVPIEMKVKKIVMPPITIIGALVYSLSVMTIVTAV